MKILVYISMKMFKTIIIYKWEDLNSQMERSFYKNIYIYIFVYYWLKIIIFLIQNIKDLLKTQMKIIVIIRFNS